MAKEPGAPSGGGDLPHGEGEPPNTPKFLPVTKGFTLVGKILQDHPYIVGGFIIFIFLVAILAGM